MSMGLFQIPKQQQEHLVSSSHYCMWTTDNHFLKFSLSPETFYSTLKFSSLKLISTVCTVGCRTLVQMPVCIWILLPLPLAQALIKEANEGGERTVKSLTCYTKFLLSKTLGKMSNARWPGGEERTSGSAFST